MAQITLATLDDTRCFAELLVRELHQAPDVKTLLLRGDLGSGDGLGHVVHPTTPGGPVVPAHD